MKEIIEQELSVLVGLPLLLIRRSVDLMSIHFGAAFQVPDERKGGTAEVGEFALHLQCPWRIVGPHGIVVGRHDLYYPASDQPEGIDLMEFDWERHGVNRCDERVSNLMAERADSPLVVTGVEADSVGSLRLTMSDGYKLEAFPDDSRDDEYSEHWRFFQPATEERHFVVTGYGIEPVEE